MQSKKLPLLLTVPGMHRDLDHKLSFSGITRLRMQTRADGTEPGAGAPKFLTRYPGSTSPRIGPSGEVYPTAKAFRLAKAPAPDPGKKRPRDEIKAGDCKKSLTNNEPQDTKNELSTEINKNCAEGVDKAKRAPNGLNKTKIRGRIAAYLGAVSNVPYKKKQLYFWTITFPKGTDDDICFKIFNTWLTSLRKYKMIRPYLWVAERQDGKRLQDASKATNTLHFHMAIFGTINVKRANAMMAGTLKGYAKRGLVPCSVFAAGKYNGVDIGKNRYTKRVINFAEKKNARSLSNYMTKYITKNDATFDHLAWHCSRELSALVLGISCTLDELLQSGFLAASLGKVIVSGDFFEFIPWTKAGPPLKFTEHINAVNCMLLEPFLN